MDVLKLRDELVAKCLQEKKSAEDNQLYWAGALGGINTFAEELLKGEQGNQSDEEASAEESSADESTGSD